MDSKPTGAEECQSSESGWTMYIGSPMQDSDDNSDSSDEYENSTQACPQDDESDDSMASDASSGPSHHHGFADLARCGEEYDGKNKCCLEKKAKETQEKLTVEGKKVAEKKGMVFVDSSKGKFQVEEGRKNYRVGGKRK
ncbi:hypothetical protein Fmac_012698 [Flemingia macrophylla]|uniref:Uncharacterized protein n=1 Tax=Flemingia macrophylla TaxID=520843 RepID=A0ABD1MRV1_9FABA